MTLLTEPLITEVARNSHGDWAAVLCDSDGRVVADEIDATVWVADVLTCLRLLERLTTRRDTGRQIVLVHEPGYGQ